MVILTDCNYEIITNEGTSRRRQSGGKFIHERRCFARTIGNYLISCWLNMYGKPCAHRPSCQGRDIVSCVETRLTAVWPHGHGKECRLNDKKRFHKISFTFRRLQVFASHRTFRGNEGPRNRIFQVLICGRELWIFAT